MRPDLNMLEALADKHELRLSDYLINFANDVWALAYKQGMKDETLAKEHSTGQRCMFCNSKLKGEDK